MHQALKMADPMPCVKPSSACKTRRARKQECTSDSGEGPALGGDSLSLSSAFLFSPLLVGSSASSGFLTQRCRPLLTVAGP